MSTATASVTKLESAAAKKATSDLRNLLDGSAHDLIELGYQLDDFFEADLHKTLGYATQKEFVEKELDCSVSHATRLKSIASYAHDLGYTMKQVQTIFARTGHLSQLRFFLYNLNEKVSVPQAIKILRQEWTTDYRDIVHINVAFKPKEAKEFDALLTSLGMERAKESGNRKNVHDAMLALMKIGKKAQKL